MSNDRASNNPDLDWTKLLAETGLNADPEDPLLCDENAAWADYSETLTEDLSAPGPSPSVQETKPPMRSFPRDPRRVVQGLLRRALVLTPFATSVAAAAIMAYGSVAGNVTALGALAGLHVAVIAGILWVVCARWFKKDDEIGRGVSVGAWAQFRLGVVTLWASWAVLYSAIFCYGASSVWWQLAMTEVLNLATGYAANYVFLVMDRPSVALPESPERNIVFKQSFRQVTWTYLGAALYSCLLFTVVGLSGSKLEGGLQFLNIAPTVVTVSMMCMFSRFSSHVLQIPRKQLLPLFAYVAIQPAWPFLSDKPEAMLVFVSAALGLKVYLAWFLLKSEAALKEYFLGHETLQPFKDDVRVLLRSLRDPASKLELVKNGGGVRPVAEPGSHG